MSDSAADTNLLDTIYDAALDSSRWTGFIETLAASASGTYCMFVRHDPIAREGEILTDSGFDPEIVIKYKNYFASINPWLKNVHTQPIGLVIPSEQRFPVSELQRTEFYADFVRPQKIHSGAGVTLLQDGSRFFALSMMFQMGHARQKPAAITRMQRLVPHLQRAARINRQLAHSAFRWQAAEETLNRLAVGVILVTADLSVVFGNRSANAILTKADGIAVGRSGRLSIADSEGASQLLHLVTMPHAGTTGALAIRRPSGERPFTMLVAPVLHAASPTELAQAVAMVFIRDPLDRSDVSNEVLSALFDLSPAEARLARTLLEGCGLQHAAEALGISHNTAKSQLKAVFDQLGCTRQSDLVRVVTSSVLNFIK
ncbi:MAG: helix-turn-helix transcriptional regulator [Rhodospirillaceae bacterium]